MLDNTQPDQQPHPSIEQQIVDLHLAGWTKGRGTVWVSPKGGYFRGPHGAWLAMKLEEKTNAR